MVTTFKTENVASTAAKTLQLWPPPLHLKDKEAEPGTALALPKELTVAVKIGAGGQAGKILQTRTKESMLVRLCILLGFLSYRLHQDAYVLLYWFVCALDFFLSVVTLPHQQSTLALPNYRCVISGLTHVCAHQDLSNDSFNGSAGVSSA